MKCMENWIYKSSENDDECYYLLLCIQHKIYQNFIYLKNVCSINIFFVGICHELWVMVLLYLNYSCLENIKVWSFQTIHCELKLQLSWYLVVSLHIYFNHVMFLSYFEYFPMGINYRSSNSNRYSVKHLPLVKAHFLWAENSM